MTAVKLGFGTERTYSLKSLRYTPWKYSNMDTKHDVSENDFLPNMGMFGVHVNFRWWKIIMTDIFLIESGDFLVSC